ncbi:MAG TPA: VWA domain-containing protein, partial [Thermoanaerobaculia bacterium]|nr:VWA domain-containing protein [Thermoanaerobaculia bacterium]
SIANDLKFTIDAMKTTINQLSGIEGRKIMIHVSDGLPQSAGAEIWKYISDRFQYAGGVLQLNFEFDRTQSYLSVIQAANSAGVTMYTIDTTGLETDSAVSAESRAGAARLDAFTEKNNLQSMLSLMSEETGGKAILNKNDVTVALKEIEKDTSSYYSLGYRSLRSGADRPHKVDVKVLKKGLTARARRSYLEKSPETRVQEAVVSALYFARDDNPLGIGIEVGTPTPADHGNYVVPITIRVPYARIAMIPDGPKARGRLVFYFMVVDSVGKESDLSRLPLPIEMSTRQLDQASKQDFKYDVKLLMIPGGQKLSLAVRDEITNSSSYLQKSIFVSALN